MIRRPLAIALFLALAACGQQSTESGSAADGQATLQTASTQSETQRFTAWLDAKYEELLMFSPQGLTMLGRKELNDQLDDQSEEAMDKRLAWSEATLAEMQANFDYDKLDEEGKTSWDIWKINVERTRAAVPFRRNGYVFQQMGGIQGSLPTFLIGFHKVENEADLYAYVARITASQKVVMQLIERARLAAAEGVHPPKFAYDGVIEQARKVISGAPFDEKGDSAIWADFQQEADALVKDGKITAEQAEEAKLHARKALLGYFQPAFQELIAWCEEDSKNALVNPAGVGTTQSNGTAYYELRLRESTTTSMTADEIHELGLREVERIHGEMIALKEKVGFQGDLDAFFEFINHDERFVYPDTDEGRQAYIDEATRLIDNIKKELPNYFGILPKADLVVKRVEAYREQPGAAQHYYAGTPDGSRPGIYYAHLSDMKAMPKPELEVIAYHEGLPGHHMQISIAQELTGLPKFRTQARFTAYSEGWGLYAEWLAREIPGTYVDPYSEFGRLSSELWRAIRLVVDTGMHAKGWTEQQAIEYFDKNSAVPLTAITSEIRRYLVWPGQATAYKIGQIKIQEARAKAEKELGDKFDIRGFHDTVLSGGALPLDVMQKRVDRWIEEKKKSA